MKKIFRNLFTASCFAIIGMFSAQTEAKALEVSVTNVSGNDYQFTIELEAGESLSSGNLLVLNNLGDVTSASASSPFTLSTIGGGFSSENGNAIFEATNIASGETTLSNVLQVTSTSSLDNVEYDLAASNLFSGVATNDAGTAVPFEFSPGLGIVLISGFISLRYFKNRSTAKLN